MNGTQVKTRRPRLSHLPDSHKNAVARQLLLPRELDSWLVDYSIREGYPSEMEAVRQMVREKREQDLQRAAA